MSDKRNNTNIPSWAKRLQDLTAKSGLPQAELARRAGMNRDAFNRYHSGKTRPPRDRLEALANVFGVHPSDIDPDRLTLVKRSDVKAVQPYSVTPAANGDPSRVRLRVDSDVTLEAMTRILEILAGEARSEDRTS